MATTVTDKIFFHINSTANRSPHDLMRRGNVIEIGEQTNPFFRFYETYARTFEVRDEAGGVEQVPAITFLRRVKEGSIAPDNLPLTAWEVSRYFMMLARELVWENVRLKEFPREPSRQRCVWLLESEDQVRPWLRSLGFAPNTHWVVRIRASGTALRADSNFLAGESEPLPVWHDKASRYWAGEMTSNPHPEVLFCGTVTVEEILIDPA